MAEMSDTDLYLEFVFEGDFILRVEEAGWVERRPDPTDRRGIMVHLTKEGHRLVDEVLEANLARQGTLLQSLSKNRQEQLANLLRDLLIGIGDI